MLKANYCTYIIIHTCNSIVQSSQRGQATVFSSICFFAGLSVTMEARLDMHATDQSDQMG